MLFIMASIGTSPLHMAKPISLMFKLEQCKGNGKYLVGCDTFGMAVSMHSGSERILSKTGSNYRSMPFPHSPLVPFASIFGLTTISIRAKLKTLRGVGNGNR